jgi:hypothetical protein
MKKMTMFLLVATSFLASGVFANPQASTQKEQTPSNISADLRTEIEKLDSPELSQRIEGAYNLGNMGESAAPAIPFLLQVLERNEGMVEVPKASLDYFEKDTAFLVFSGKAATINPAQIVASVALVKIGKPALGPLRAALLKADPTELPFAYVAEALTRMQDPTTTKMLLGMLSSENRHTRFRIAEALAHSKDPASVDALIGALKDQDSSVKSSAARSLKRITGQDFGEDAGKWQEWRAKNKPTQ